MPAAVVTFLVGVSAFAALGMAVAGLCPSASAASAVANAIILPMAFVSGIFIPLEDPPAWLATLGDVLPLKPFVESFQDAFNPSVEPPAFDWGDLALVAAWGVVGRRRCHALVQVGAFPWWLDPPPAGHDGSRGSGLTTEWSGERTCSPS